MGLDGLGHRRSSAVIGEYTWLITLADDLRSIEATEYSLANNKAFLVRYEPGGDLTKKTSAEQLICDGSMPERTRNKIEFLEMLLDSYYKSVKNQINFLYEFDSLEYRIVYEFITTGDSLYEVGKRLKTKTTFVKQVLSDVDKDLYNAFSYLDHSIDGDMNKEFIKKYTTLFIPDFCDYMRRRVKNLNKKLAS